MPVLVLRHQRRLKTLSDEEKELIGDMARVGVAPEDILAMLRIKFKDGMPVLTAQDIAAHVRRSRLACCSSHISAPALLNN